MLPVVTTDWLGRGCGRVIDGVKCPVVFLKLSVLVAALNDIYLVGVPTAGHRVRSLCCGLVCCPAWCKRDMGLRKVLLRAVKSWWGWTPLTPGPELPQSSCYQHFKSRGDRHKKLATCFGSCLTIPQQYFFSFSFSLSQINIVKAAMPYCIVIAFSITFPFDNTLRLVTGACCQDPGSVSWLGLETSLEHATVDRPIPWGMWGSMARQPWALGRLRP